MLVAWFTAAVRAAFTAVERTRVEERARESNARAARVLRLLDNLPRAFAPIGWLNIVALGAATLTAMWLSLEIAPNLAVEVANLAVLFVVWLAGRTLAVWLGASRAPFLAELTAPLVEALVWLATPFLALDNWLIRQARGTTHQTERVTSDDFQIIVTEGNQERKLEEIEPEEREMIAGIIEMSERTARDLMVPRLDVNAIEINAPLDDVLDVAARYGHSRLPVYEGDIDHLIGILHVKDLLQKLRYPEHDKHLRDFLRPVHYVPDTARADDLLRDLLRNRVHMAVVVDEYGGTVGLVTIEDALEEIVGEIRDEYDAAEEPEFIRVNENEAVFNARVPITEVNDVLDLQLPTEDTDTLGGLVYSLLGRLARAGDHVQVGEIDLQVTAVQGRRIKKVHVKRSQPAEKGENIAE